VREVSDAACWFRLARTTAGRLPLSRLFEQEHKRRVRHFLLFYEGAPDYLDRRPQLRGAHLGHAWAAHDRGELVVAGALANPVDGAVLMFAGESQAVAEEFARTDPYVTNGLVQRWHVREWTTVIGDLAATPIHPEDA
jgi:uncharacterized protein YciI